MIRILKPIPRILKTSETYKVMILIQKSRNNSYKLLNKSIGRKKLQQTQSAILLFKCKQKIFSFMKFGRLSSTLKRKDNIPGDT